MSIGVCYNITNPNKSIQIIVNNLTDFMFDNGWRIVEEVPATSDTKVIAHNNEVWFDNIMYAEYQAKNWL